MLHCLIILKEKHKQRLMAYSTIIKKKCLTCKKSFTLDNFYHTTKRGKPYIHPHCITCSRDRCGKVRLSKIKLIEDLPNEKWVKIFDGKYEISNKERFKSLTRKYAPTLINPVISKSKKRKDGYYYVGTSIDGKHSNYTLHRLLAKTFIPNPKNLPTVNHKNGIKTDNRLVNLEWCSYAYNNQHARKTGLNNVIKGERVGSSKLRNEQVIEIFNSPKSGVDLAKLYKVSVWCISCIKTGERWSHLTGKKHVKKTQRFIEYKGKTKNLAEWAKFFGVNHSTLWERLKNKQTFEKIYNFYEKKKKNAA